MSQGRVLFCNIFRNRQALEALSISRRINIQRSNYGTVQAQQNGDTPTLGGPVTVNPTLGGPVTYNPTLGGPVTVNPTLGGPEKNNSSLGGPEKNNPRLGGPEKNNPSLGGPVTVNPTLGGPVTGNPTVTGPITNEIKSGTQIYNENIKKTGTEFDKVRLTEQDVGHELKSEDSGQLQTRKGEIPGKGPPPEVPVFCCQSGCHNCVWLDYVEELKAYYEDGGQRALEAIDQIEDVTLRTILKMELA